ncbi:hypothetical protein Ddc_09931 [Ditylenchus destructor]|nr:hypothetical protein Ddc_09931 [Ditylenchus destructor]
MDAKITGGFRLPKNFTSDLWSFDIEQIINASRVYDEIDPDYCVHDFRKELGKPPLEDKYKHDIDKIFEKHAPVDFPDGSHVQVIGRPVLLGNIRRNRNGGYLHHCSNDSSQTAYHLKVEFLPSNIRRKVTDQNAEPKYILPLKNDPWEFHIIFAEETNCYSQFLGKSGCYDGFMSGDYWIRTSFMCQMEREAKLRKCVYIWAGSGTKNMYAFKEADGFQCSHTSLPLSYDTIQTKKGWYTSIPSHVDGLQFKDIRLVVFGQLDEPEFSSDIELYRCYLEENRHTLYKWACFILVMIILTSFLCVTLVRKFWPSPKNEGFVIMHNNDA